MSNGIGRLKSGLGAIKSHAGSTIKAHGEGSRRVYSGSITQRAKDMVWDTVTDPVKVGAIAVGVAIAAPISLAVDKILYDGWDWGFKFPGLKNSKLPVLNWDVPIPALVDYKWTIIPKVRGNPKDEFNRSLTAGIIGTVISGGVSAVVYTKLDKEIGKCIAFGAGLSLTGFIIKGLVQWAAAEAEQDIKKGFTWLEKVLFFWKKNLQDLNRDLIKARKTSRSLDRQIHNIQNNYNTRMQRLANSQAKVEADKAKLGIPTDVVPPELTASNAAKLAAQQKATQQALDRMGPFIPQAMKDKLAALPEEQIDKVYEREIKNLDEQDQLEQIPDQIQELQDEKTDIDNYIVAKQAEIAQVEAQTKAAETAVQREQEAITAQKIKAAIEKQMDTDKWIKNKNGVEYYLHQDLSSKLWQVRVKVAQFPSNDPKIGQNFIVAYLMNDKTEAYKTANAITPDILTKVRGTPTKGNVPAVMDKSTVLPSTYTAPAVLTQTTSVAKYQLNKWITNPQGVEINVVQSSKDKYDVRLRDSLYPKNNPKTGQNYVVAYVFPTTAQAFDSAQKITTAQRIQALTKAVKGGAPVLTGYIRFGRVMYRGRPIYHKPIYHNEYGNEIVNGELMIGDVPASIIAMGRSGSVI